MFQKIKINKDCYVCRRNLFPAQILLSIVLKFLFIQAKHVLVTCIFLSWTCVQVFFMLFLPWLLNVMGNVYLEGCVWQTGEFMLDLPFYENQYHIIFYNLGWNRVTISWTLNFSRCLHNLSLVLYISLRNKTENRIKYLFERLNSKSPLVCTEGK